MADIPRMGTVEWLLLLAPDKKLTASRAAGVLAGPAGMRLIGAGLAAIDGRRGSRCGRSLRRRARLDSRHYWRQS